MVIPNTCVEWIEKQRTRNIRFEDVISHDFELIKPYMPAVCKKIIDIGCGIGGIDVLISEHYKNDIQIDLFDFPEQNEQYNEKIQYGFNDKYLGYNSFDQTEKFLKANGITKYNLIDASYGSLPFYTDEYDIVISLLSCGYHYPVKTYIEGIVDIISTKGILILDIREGTDGIKEVEKYFKSVTIIATENKADKIIAKGIKW